MTRQPHPCPRPARPLGACDASLFPTGHPPVPAESPGHPVSRRLCACGSGHVLSLCLPSSSAASMPSGDLGPPSPSCDVREELGKRDLVGRRPSCQTGLPSRIFQVSVRSPGSFRERCSAAARWPHRQEWGRGFRNLPQPSPPCRSPPGQFSWLSLPSCRAWRAQASCGGPGSPPVPLAQCLREECSGRNKMGVSGCRGFPRPVRGAVLDWVLAPNPPAGSTPDVSLLKKDPLLPPSHVCLLPRAQRGPCWGDTETSVLSSAEAPEQHPYPTGRPCSHL